LSIIQSLDSGQHKYLKREFFFYILPFYELDMRGFSNVVNILVDKY